MSDDWDDYYSECKQKIEIVKDDGAPTHIYNKLINKMVPNHARLKCSCGIVSPYGNHSDYCEFVTGKKDR